MNKENFYKDVIAANIEVHSKLADFYNQVEPHFRSESIERVTDIVAGINANNKINRALDLGCGTGFMINILKNFADEIIGVDVTRAMLDKVDSSGSAKIELIEHDTGSVELPAESFDIATAYSFLDHLFDMKPTINTAYKSLKKGGYFYADLSPNFYFWEQIKKLDRSKSYDPIIEREIKAVNQKDEEIQKEFGVDKDVFTIAEYGKHVRGGLIEEELEILLKEIGFEQIDFVYHWFIGQAQLVNEGDADRNQRLSQAQLFHNILTRSLPISRPLFKYIGFIAKK